MSWRAYDQQILPELKHRSYEKKDVVLDVSSYQNCAFNDCRLIYRGGPCRMVSCYIGPGCT